MSEFREIQSLIKEIHWGRLLGLWAACLYVLPPDVATFAMLLSLAAASDIRDRIVPNTVCLSIAGLGCIHMILSGGFQWTMINVLAALILLLLIKAFFKDGIGMGDIKLLLASAFLLNVFSIAVGMLLGCVLAAVIGSLRFRSLKESMPLAPFLAVGLTVVYFF